MFVKQKMQILLCFSQYFSKELYYSDFLKHILIDSIA